jgi:D-serine deaminase-like pyridoxal phosphate-dependent protein
MTRAPSKVAELSTPALIVDHRALTHNLETMATARPQLTLRPHIKAHKCTALARLQAEIGHQAFTCATVREMVGMARAGLGYDLLLANETVDSSRLADLARCQDTARITVAVDSAETIAAAAKAGVRSVVIDVNVGLPRCGCDPTQAPALAELSMAQGLEVRGVMGYEGHLMALPNDDDKARRVDESMAALTSAFAAVQSVAGSPCTIISAGGTGTFHLFEQNDVIRQVNEVQAGSYVLMDTHYGALGLPFEQALYVVGTVIASNPKWAVVDVGLKSLGMDHGNPTIAHADVWFCSDEHTTFASHGAVQPAVGSKVFVIPAHVDPTVAMHENMYRVSAIDPDGVILDEWAVDLRGWSTQRF